MNGCRKMKESWKKINCTKIQMTPQENEDIVSKDRKSCRLLDFIFSIFLYIILILAIITTILLLRRVHIGEKSLILTQLSKNELKDVVTSIINDDFHELFVTKGLSDYIGKVQLLDDNNNVLWSEDLNANDLVDIDDFSPLNFESIENYENDDNKDLSAEISPDVVRRTRSTDEIFPSLLSRLVNCARFRLVRRGKYLVSPSLDVLHTCYQSGNRLDELENGEVPHNRSSLRYDLENLYLKCEEVFTQAIQDLTPELAEDYRRCKRAGAVGRRGADFIEHRFAQNLAGHDQESETTETNIPETLQSSTSSLPRLDIRAFVNCAHVEYETSDYSPESPNEAALQLCERHGVTVEEIGRGIVSNPRSDPYNFDTDNLYIPCEEAFASGLNWITKELIKDYHRCKALGLITQQTGRIIEDTFYEHIHGGAPEESPVKSTTDYEASAESSAPPATTTPATYGRHAFANCRRIENKPYRICIKMIASYSAPANYV